MKKALKNVWKVLRVVLLILALLLTAVFIWHRICLSNERPLREPLGQTVLVDGHRLSIYKQGKGTHTLVFLSGSGVPSPVMEYKPLYSLLTDDCKIVVVERFGYGFSDVTEDERTLDTVLRQDRDALAAAGIEGPYVLCPHSMAGLEALLWAQTYPDETEAIIGLDMALPRTYDSMDLEHTAWLDYVFAGAREMGIVRLLLSDSAFPEALSQNEKDIYKAIACKNYCNRTVHNEGLHIRDAVKQIESSKPALPMLLFVSNGTDTGIDEETWRSYPREFIRNLPDASLIELDCGHMLNREMPEEISAEMHAFIQQMNNTTPMSLP